MSTDAAAAAPQHSIENLVFVGNLPFRASEEELKDFFAPAGSVLSVNIITRGTRSLGYGFVQFSAQSECEKAVELCHKKELNGREINVEVAKPKSELPARAPRAPRAPKKTAEPRQQETEDGVVISHADGEKSKKKRKPRKKTKKPAAEGEAAPAPAAPKPKRQPRERRPPPSGEPSKTTVFIANLPFTLTNETLGTVFGAYKVKAATVVVRKATGRSKGFGFVELVSEAEQARLLKDVEDGLKFLSEERELGVKIALSDQQEAADATA